MSSKLWQVRGEREEQWNEDVRDRRVRRNLRGARGVVSDLRLVVRQFVGTGGGDEGVVDDGLYSRS